MTYTIEPTPYDKKIAYWLNIKLRSLKFTQEFLERQANLIKVLPTWSHKDMECYFYKDTTHKGPKFLCYF